MRLVRDDQRVPLEASIQMGADRDAMRRLLA
jgi:hypothetical protein